MTDTKMGTRVIEAATCVNGLEEQPLRPCASAGEQQVPTTGRRESRTRTRTKRLNPEP